MTHSFAHRVGSNRVPVYYEGGKGIDRFRRETSSGSGPEDWIGSVSALPPSLLPAGAAADVGVSQLLDGTSLRAALLEDPVGWLGPVLAGRWPGEIGLLVKLLDAGQRLPVHWHPDRPFAGLHLNSPFGKTEGWIVMDEAPGGEVWLGFKAPVQRTHLVQWIETQNVEAMLAAMHRFPAGPGDVFYVPAGTPHAIGPDVMLAELQEPTSFSILAEYAAFGLDERQATLGLGWDVALQSIDLVGASSIDVLRPKGRDILRNDDARVVALFDEAADPFFTALRATVHREWKLPASFAVLIVETGAGSIAGNDREEPVSAGQTWVVPQGAGRLNLRGELRCLLCLPPLTP